MSTTLTFDSLGYFDRLKNAGVPESQARVEADTIRQHTDATNAIIKTAIKEAEESVRRELATKDDIQDVRLEIHNLRLELKSDIKDLRLVTQSDIKDLRYALLKWMIAIVASGVATLAMLILKLDGKF